LPMLKRLSCVESGLLVLLLHQHSSVDAMCAPALEPPKVLAAAKDAIARLPLPPHAADRVEGYIGLLLEYNERTNVYSKSAYHKLPFHIEDSVTLALHAATLSTRGVLDLGSGSGLPSLLIACVNPDLPVFAVESKSRKTRFLSHAAKKLGLSNYLPLTQNVNELARSWCFDADVVTAKAFKPIPEVPPIARKCIRDAAQLLIPVSEAQVHEHSLQETKLHRDGRFVYFTEQLEPSRGTTQRKLVTKECAPG